MRGGAVGRWTRGGGAGAEREREEAEEEAEEEEEEAVPGVLLVWCEDGDSERAALSVN